MGIAVYNHQKYYYFYMKKKTYSKEDMTLEDFKEFIAKTYRYKYAGKYTLDESTWVDKNMPMKIHCREHGWFTRKPIEFGEGFVCPYETNAMKNNFEWRKRAFVEKARMKFGDRFDYNMDEFIDCKNEITITCKKHGEFKDTPDHHLLRVDGGCIACYKQSMHDNFVKETEQFIEESKKIWRDNAFDYSDLNYINRHEHITLTCKKHGIKFEQTAYKHLKGHKQCPECLREDNVERNLMKTSEFIERSSKVHNNRYTYNNTDTKKRDENGKVTITCPIHGNYQQDPIDHIAGRGCPKCAGTISKPEEEIKKHILALSPNENIIQGSYKILGKKEIDLYFPDKKIAIEFDGIYWHTEQFGRGKYYHLDKLNGCNKNGINLMHIFEDEWIEHKDVVLAKITHILHIGSYEKKIRGHKCTVNEISQLIAKPFFENNHIQGYVPGSIILGAFYDSVLVGAVIFKKEATEGCYELTRMATKNNYLCHGVCGKLFKYFVNNYNPTRIKSFADRRWTIDKDSNLYTSLGFKLDETLAPDYRYVVNNQRLHKFGFRKQILHKKYNLPLSMTEKEMCDSLVLLHLRLLQNVALQWPYHPSHHNCRLLVM